VCTSALWPRPHGLGHAERRQRMTKHEAPGGAWMPAGSGRHSLTFRHGTAHTWRRRSWRRSAHQRLRRIRRSGLDYHAGTPRCAGMDSSSRPARFIALPGPRGDHRRILGAGGFGVVMSAAPIRSPRSDGIDRRASTRTTTSSDRVQVSARWREIFEFALFLISSEAAARCCRFPKPTLNLPLFRFVFLN